MAAAPHKVQAALAKRQRQAARREALAPLRRDIARLEAELERLRGGIAQIDAALASHELYQRDPEQAVIFNQKRSRALQRIDEVETLWLKAQERFEHARNT